MRTTTRAPLLFIMILVRLKYSRLLSISLLKTKYIIKFYPFFHIFVVFSAFIALLRLKVTNRPYCAKETRFVKTACLPNQPFSSGTECVISGWGATETRKHQFSHSG